jgi:signal transduction histidine kinase
MRERADALGAELAIESAPMDGTRVTLTLDRQRAGSTSERQL